MARAITFLLLISTFSPLAFAHTPALRASRLRTNNHALNAALEVQVAKGPWNNVVIWVWGEGSRSLIAAGQKMKPLLKPSLESKADGFVVLDRPPPNVKIDGKQVKQISSSYVEIDGVHVGGFNEFLDRVWDKDPGVFKEFMNKVCEVCNKEVCDDNFMQMYPGRLIKIMSYLKKKESDPETKDLLVFINNLLNRVYNDFNIAVDKKDGEISKAFLLELPHLPVPRGVLMEDFMKL